MSKVITDEEIRRMRNYRKGGWQISWIVKTMGYSEPTVARYTSGCEENAIPDMTLEEIKEIKKLKAENNHPRKIMNLTGRSKHAVIYAMTYILPKEEPCHKISENNSKEPTEKIRFVNHSGVKFRINKDGYRVMPKGYIGLRTRVRPDGKW